MDKEDMMYRYSGILVSHKKELNNAICSNIDGPSDQHTECNNSERKIPDGITCIWNLKYDINELVYKTETDSQTQRKDLWLLKKKQSGGEME